MLIELDRDEMICLEGGETLACIVGTTAGALIGGAFSAGIGATLGGFAGSLMFCRWALK